MTKPKVPIKHEGLFIEGWGVFEISSESRTPRWTSWEHFNRNNDATIAKDWRT